MSCSSCASDPEITSHECSSRRSWLESSVPLENRRVSPEYTKTSIHNCLSEVKPLEHCDLKLKNAVSQRNYVLCLLLQLHHHSWMMPNLSICQISYGFRSKFFGSFKLFHLHEPIFKIIRIGKIVQQRIIRSNKSM